MNELFSATFELLCACTRPLLFDRPKIKTPEVSRERDMGEKRASLGCCEAARTRHGRSESSVVSRSKRVVSFKYESCVCSSAYDTTVTRDD